MNAEIAAALFEGIVKSSEDNDSCGPNQHWQYYDALYCGNEDFYKCSRCEQVTS